MSIWDEALPESTEENYPVAVAGTYEFEVVNSTAKEYVPKPGAKMKKCANLNIRLRVEGKDENGRNLEVSVFENLYSDPIAVWKMTDFAKAIGIYHPGMTPRELHDKCVGQIGRAEFKIGKDLKGNARNEVAKFIIPAQPSVSADDLPF